VELAEGASVLPDFLTPAHLMRRADDGGWTLLCRDAAGDPAAGARLSYLCQECGGALRREYRAGRLSTLDMPPRWIRSLVML
jgi:hypothetical protein